VGRHRRGAGPPVADPAGERRPAEVLRQATRAGLLAAADDLSAGGLVQTRVDGVLRFGTGASVTLTELCLRDGVDATTALFSESGGRVLVAVPAEAVDRLTALAEEHGVTLLRVGTTGGDTLDVTVPSPPGAPEAAPPSLPLAELRETSEATPAAHFA